MKKTVLLFLAGSISGLSFGQAAQLVFNGSVAGDPYIVFNTAGTVTPTYLVIDNPAANAIVQTPANAGNIKSEHENNRIRWTNYNTTNTYVVPFTTASNVKMPLQVTKTTTGAGAAGNDSLSFVLATYSYRVITPPPGTEWLNFNYMPTGVTHMNDFGLGSVDNSENAIDRFWIIDPQQGGYAYTTKPNITVDFKYDQAEVTVGNLSNGGIIPTSVLGAQRFNQPLQKWGDFLPAGNGVVPGTVSAAVVSGTNFFRSWTLSSVANPLPIELTSWSGACDGKEVKLMWSTASEHNNDHFAVEKSRDGASWEEIGRVQAAGNSVTNTIYSYVDENTAGLAYYRLSQVDADGNSQTFDVVAAGCDANNTEIVNAWDDGNDVNVVVSSTDAGIYDLALMDASGKTLVVRPAQAIVKGYTPFKLPKTGISTGMYVISLQNANDVMTRRVMLH